MKKLRAGILGATGSAGMEFVNALYDHPQFEVDGLYASPRNAGKPFSEATTFDTGHLPDGIKSRTVRSLGEIGSDYDILCSALPSDIAGDVEGECARHTPVISTTSAYRYESDVPIIITEINPEHYRLIEAQRRRGWEGWVAPGPNCTTVGLVMSLYPLHQALDIRRVYMSSSQAVSGGGYSLLQRWKSQRTAELPEPVHSAEPVEVPEDVMVEGNVIGHIPNEEGKVQTETGKILGDYREGMIVPAGFEIECLCSRVPVVDGHYEAVFVETEKSCSAEGAAGLYESANERNRDRFGSLPSSPGQTFYVLDRPPMPFYDAYLGGGMSIAVGRIQETPHGLKYQVMSNNVVKGAAKGMVQVAEYVASIGFLKAK